MLYTLPEANKVIQELVRVVRPGGVIHFLCEDYGSVLAHPTRLDNREFWRRGPCVLFQSQACNPYMGRSIFTEAVRACKAAARWDEATVTTKMISVDTGVVRRDLMAGIFGSWRDYTEYLAQHTELSAEEVHQHWDDIIECCLNEEGYVAWQCTVCSIVFASSESIRRLN